jgi:hypothetical protein
MMAFWASDLKIILLRRYCEALRRGDQRPLGIDKIRLTFILRPINTVEAVFMKNNSNLTGGRQ